MSKAKLYSMYPIRLLPLDCVGACTLLEIDPSQKCIYICHCPCQHLHICVRTLTPLEVADKFV